MLSATPVFTVGHSSHTFEYFVSLLEKWEIAAVADVRSSPFSRWQPQFSKHPLQERLGEAGIAYVFLGAELGGRGTDESVLDDHGRVRYRSIAETTRFRDGLNRVQKGHMSMSLALLCTERDPIECHRGLLVSRFLVAKGIEVIHIHADGRTETHSDAEQRLLRLTGLQGPDLFRTEDEVLDEAYKRQEARVAYVRNPSVPVGGPS